MTAIELTDEDRDAIDRAYDEEFNPLDRGAASEREAIYRAGMRAGAARQREIDAEIVADGLRGYSNLREIIVSKIRAAKGE